MHCMRSVLWMVLTCCIPTGVPAQEMLTPSADAPEENVGKEQARQANDRWLALVDGARWSDSWKQASTAFRAAVPEAKWMSGIAGVRDPLGRVQRRDLASAVFSTHLPGVADGQYVLTQYRTSFEHKAQAVETVVAQRDADGTWRISGYYLQ